MNDSFDRPRRARAHGLPLRAAAPRRTPPEASAARRRATIRSGAAAAALVAVTGCASLSPDGGAGTVAELTSARTGQTVSAQRSAAEIDAAGARARELLAQPLTPDRAVEVALLQHRGLQASLAQLGIADAERVRAGRLANPALRFGHLSGGGTTEIDRSMLFDLVGLFTLPIASRVAEDQLEQKQHEVAAEALRLAAQARKAFFRAVAAQDLLTYHARVMEAADASNELARRMAQAGNASKLAQMQQQAFHADATAALALARHRAVVERERLVRVLGLPNDASLVLPERLPDLPPAPIEPKDAEQTALDHRLDVLLARRRAAATARALGLTKATRFVNVLEAGYANKSQTGEPRRTGYEIELELPLFDFGATRAARAEAIYLQAVHRTAEVAVDARSEVRTAYSAYRTAYDVARHYRDEVVPLRKRISEENLLRYNGMLIGVFELLADAKAQVLSVAGAIEALRDHWLAETDLQTALTAGSPEPDGALRSPASPVPASADAGH